MIYRIPFCLIFLFSLISSSQEHHIVGGILADANDDVIAYANIVLIDPEGLKPTIGATTNESGIFIIEGIKTGNYNLNISYLGFKSYSRDILIDNNIELGVIYLLENIEELEGVTVIAKRPTVKRYVDKLVFNIENSTLSNSNVLDVLKQTPGVLVSNEDITIKQSVPTIYINDKRVYLSSREVQQLLEGTSATNVKSIEVINNPSARYDAEGGAVLNIITSKNIISGYNGDVFGNFKHGTEFPKYSFGTSHFFKTKKLNTYLSYSISPRKDFLQIKELINFKEKDGEHDFITNSSWDTDFNRTEKSMNQNINTNIDYELNDRNRIGFTMMSLISPRDNTKFYSDSWTKVFNSEGVFTSFFNTTNKKVDETFNFAFTLDYIHKFKKKGKKISLNIHHTHYDFASFQNVDTDYFLPDSDNPFLENRFQTFTSQLIKLNAGKIDYTIPINESGLFDAGIKVSDINSDNVLNQFTIENASIEEDIPNSDTFLYDETNYAGYVNYSNKWDRWSLKAGIRIEHTNIKGNSISTDQINNSNYVKFFPSFYFKNVLNENNEIYFKYNKRIYRPKYNQLNPFKYFLNDNAYVVGDPNLKPQIDDVFILGYTFNQDYTFELYYRHEKNPILQFIFQDNDEELLIYKNTNTDTSISYGLDFTTYKSVLNNWSLYILSSIYYYKNNFFLLDNNNSLFTGDRWSLYAEIANDFTFLKDKSLIANVSFVYWSPTNDGPTDTSSRSGLNLSFKKSIWNNKASLSAGIVDIFNTQNFNTSTKYLNQDSFIKYNRENRLITFGFNYKFGNSKLRTNKKEINMEERVRLNP
ncbi:outer membrane beta-barrel protein [uncultured Algibacter sp.]|uniref:outer membrane beta-barrel protein n=1 Tax=uncultured Algibacter sp. TaxID=298659 RepID=UPI0026308942|nr:outer membrane beta-barrel protein [uncultured Algibacter sp.]